MAGSTGPTKAGSTEGHSVFACDMGAIEPGRRDQHIATAVELFQAVQVIKELPDGYAFRLPGETALLLKAAEFVSLERLCCPFFGFQIVVEPEGGALWVHLTGPEGVKPFIQAEIGEAVNETAARPTNFHRGGADAHR